MSAAPDAESESDGERRVIRLRGREGAEVEWSRKAARRAGTLRGMMADATPENGVYPVPMVAEAELTMLGAMCEDNSTPADLAQLPVPELFRVVEGANYLDAPEALQQLQQAVKVRLADKRADELRALLGATDDLSAEERAAALAEPAFTPEGDTPTPPALQPQPSHLMVAEDAKEEAVRMLEVGTLVELKGVSRSWRALARRVLCSRLCHADGQPMPKELAEITDISIKDLVEAGRPWEAAAAGRLPNLARLRWGGLLVDVGAVRGVDLDEKDEDEEDEDEEDENISLLSSAAEAVLLGCIEGEGEGPLELLLAAVACAGSGEVRGIPVEAMRNDSVAQLGLEDHQIGEVGGMLISYLVPVMASLTAINVGFNDIDQPSARLILDAIKGKNMQSIGMAACSLGAEEGKILAKYMRVMASLTSCDLSSNNLADESAWVNPKEVHGSPTVGSKVVYQGSEMIISQVYSDGDVKMRPLNWLEGITAIADAIADAMRINASLTSLSMHSNKIGAVGGVAIADALRVNASLTSCNVLKNNLDVPAAKALVEAVKDKDVSLCGIRPDETSTGSRFVGEGLKPPDAILLASDLSKAGVSASLTKAGVRNNSISGEGASQLAAAVLANTRIEKFNDIPIKEMRADSLTKLELSQQQIDVVGGLVVAGLLPVMASLTECNLGNNKLGDEGADAIATALKESTTSKLQKLEMYINGIGPKGAAALAFYMAVSASLTSVNLTRNNLTGETGYVKASEVQGISFEVGDKVIYQGREMLISTGKDSDGEIRMMPLDRLSVINAVADALRVSASLTEVDLRWNNIGAEGEAAIKEAVRGKEGFKLQI